MNEPQTQDLVDKEIEAVVLQMNRNHRVSYLKFGAAVLLILCAALTVVSMAAAIPAAVMSIMGQ